MKNVVLGKITKTRYCLDLCKIDGEWIHMPEIKKEIFESNDEEICSFDGDVMFNQRFWGPDTLNIDENTTVRIEKCILRADLGEVHLFTDYVIKNEDSNKQETEEIYNKWMAEFNSEMIAQDDRMSSYCKLHKLNPAETDVFDLYKIIYEETGELRDGKIKNVTLTCPHPFPATAEFIEYIENTSGF